MSITLTRLLNSYCAENQSPALYPLTKKFNYYSPRGEIISRQGTSFLSLEEILADGLSNLQQLLQISCLINKQVENVKYPLLNSQKMASDKEDYSAYLQLKSKVFHSFYLPESSLNEPANTSAYGFRVEALAKFDQFLRSTLIALFHQISSDSPKGINRLLIIETHYLANQIKQLLKQITLAAFPFRRGDRLLGSIDIKILQGIKSFEFNESYERFQQQEKKMIEDFMEVDQEDLGSPLFLLQQQMKLVMAKYETAQPVSYSITDSFHDGLQGYSFLIKQDQLQCMKIQFEISRFVSKYYELVLNPQLEFQTILQMMAEQPLKKYDKDELSKLRYALEEYPVDLEQYAILYYGVIDCLVQYNNRNIKNEKYPAFLLNLISTTQKWFIFQQSDKIKLLFYEHYVKILQLYIQIKGNQYASINKISIFNNFSEYIKRLEKSMKHGRQKLRNDLIFIDQEFTFDLLISNKMIASLNSKKVEIRNVFDQAIPQLTVFSHLLNMVKLVSSNDKMQLINEVLAKINYLSLLTPESIATLSSVSTAINQTNNLQKILQLQTTALNAEMPQLMELRNIIILLEILNPPKSTNLQQVSKITQTYLSELAQYFSRPRPFCKIYEIKSKILFFICLFEMGYHIPKFTEGETTIDLRPRIINLFTKISQQNSSKLLTSKMGKSVMGQCSIYNHPGEFQWQAEHKGDELSIKASSDLDLRIRNFIAETFSEADCNWKEYLTNRMNIMQHELFLDQRNKIKREEDKLLKNYLQHIKNCLKEINRGQSDNFHEILLEIQGCFFKERYDKGWSRLILEIESNPSFEKFFQQILELKSKQVELFKFIRVYRHYIKIESSLTQSISKTNIIKFETTDRQNLRSIIQFINRDAIFEIEEQSVVALYETRMKRKRELQLLDFFKKRQQNSDLLDISYSRISQFSDLQSEKDSLKKESTHEQKPKIAKIDESNQLIGSRSIVRPFQNNIMNVKDTLIPDNFEVFDPTLINEITRVQQQQVYEHRLSSYGVVIKKKLTNLQIQIDKKHSTKFSAIRETLAPLSLLLQTEGIAKITNIGYKSGSQWKKALIIDISMIPYRQENSKQGLESLIKHFLQKMIQINNVYLKGQKRVELKYSSSEIDFNEDDGSFCINPFLLIIQNAINNPQKRSKWLYEEQAQIIEAIITIFENRMTQFFKENCRLYLSIMKRCQRKDIIILITLPLFQSHSQQAEKIIDFAKKLIQISKNSQNSLISFLKTNANIDKIIKKCDQTIKSQSYKVYSYLFGWGSILELLFLEQNICTPSNKPSKKLLWLENPNFPVNTDGMPMGQTRYSLISFIDYLRKILSRQDLKIEETIQLINRSFPKLQVALHFQASKIRQNYDKIFSNKLAILKECFKVQKLESELKLITESSDSRTLHTYFKRWRQMQPRLKASIKSITCFKCKKMETVLSKPESENLIDFLTLLSKTDATTSLAEINLSSEHAVKSCFLREQFKDHRAVTLSRKAFGLPDSVDIRYFVPLNWWFFFESKFPSLFEILTFMGGSSNLEA